MADFTDDLGEEFDNSFSGDDIEKFAIDIAEEVLRDAAWDEAAVPQQINTICEKLMKALVARSRPYKYVVTCLIQQKTNATCHSSMACHWENNVDGTVFITYPPMSRAKDSQQKTIQCLITVFCTRF